MPAKNRIREVFRPGTALALALLCGAAAPALGQNQLDNNLQVGGTRANPGGRDYQAEFRFRNAIVTGNAPGGMSFRGDVGYRAPGEFFDRLGSDETFTFRRDSLVSGLGGVGIRGTDALQYQFALVTGNAPPRGFIGLPEYVRAGAKSTAGSLHGTEFVPTQDSVRGAEQLRGLRLRDDDRGQALMSVRSTSSYIANRGFQPAVIGRTQTQEDGSFQAMTASVLRGVAYDDFNPMAKREKEAFKPTEAAQTVETGALRETPAEPANAAAASERMGAGPAPKSEYQKYIERLESDAMSGLESLERPAAKADGERAARVPEWQRRIDELRIQLDEDRRRAALKAVEARRAAEEQEKEKELTGKQGEKEDDKTDEKGDEKIRREDGRPRARTGFDPATLDMLRNSAGRITHLAPPGFDAYGLQMKAGQDNLAAGRFFDAEERFAAALSVKPGDPMAAIGRVHAQIGAGMFLSAALNLRTLFTENPQLVGIRYGDELLPSKERRVRLIERLSELSAEGDGRGREPALLLAYMGFQSGDAAARGRGIQVMLRGADGSPADDQLARLATLCEEVWSSLPPPPEPEK